MDDEDLAQGLNQHILGGDRTAMPCGCVMAIRWRKYSGGRSYRVYSHPIERCQEHRFGCPYVNQALDE